MTEHSKIKPAQSKPSLFERADAAFGLDQLGPVAVPRDLPAPKALRQERLPTPGKPTPGNSAPDKTAPDKAAYTPAPSAEAPVEPVHGHGQSAVELRGPCVAIDREALKEAGLIVPEDPVTGLLEEFRIVKRELLADARAAHHSHIARRILVCSPLPGEGKTYCATNLAIALAAERDIEVILIDADVLNPSVAPRLGLEPQSGLMDALTDASVQPEDLVARTDIDGLFVMQAGTSSALDAEFLTSARTGEVFDRLTRNAPNRYLVLDTPPALAASPAAELAGHVGQALLVVRADDTSHAALEDARQLLSGCADVKLLLNAAQFSPSGRRFGDYGYGKEG